MRALPCPAPTRRAVLTGAAALLATGCARRAPEARLGTSAPAPRVIPPAFADADPVAWTGRSPAEYPVHGIDLSRFQGAVDWAQGRAAGVNFAFIKATEGGDRLDPMFAANLAGAWAAGVAAGAYHFHYFCTPAEVQARWVIANVPRAPGTRPPVIDLEWNPHSPTCTLRPDPATVRAEVARLRDILARHYGQQPILYSVPGFWQENDIARLGGEVWLRSTAAQPSEVFAGARWTFWQYSGTGRIAGIAGPVDLNAFAGSAARWRSWLEARAIV